MQTTPADAVSLGLRASDLISKNVKFKNYQFQVHVRDNTVQLFADFFQADIYTGAQTRQRTRRWNLQPQMTDSEIITTAFKLCLTSVEHEARENFLYKNARIFGPHFDVNDLADLCQTRENAGGRNPVQTMVALELVK